MILLKALKNIVLNGKFIRVDDYIQTDNPEVFLRPGYARKLTLEETRAILKSYVEFAEKVFEKSAINVSTMPQAENAANAHKDTGFPLYNSRNKAAQWRHPP